MGFGVSGSEIGGWGLRCGDKVVKFGVRLWGVGFGAYGLRVRDHGVGFGFFVSETRVHGFKFWVEGFGSEDVFERQKKNIW